MSHEFETTLHTSPNSHKKTVAMSFDPMSMGYFDHAFMERMVEALSQRAVDEIWKVHGPNILRKVDKKTIGNLTVKKLSALIAQELKAPAPKKEL